MNSEIGESKIGFGFIAILLLTFSLATGNASAAKPVCGDGKCSGK